MQGKVIVVMGVSSCGKTTVGKIIANKWQVTFLEGDDFHSAHNIQKMKAGEPLNDTDREDWLKAIHSALIALSTSGQNCVVACSALKRKYRDVLRKDIKDIAFIYLKGTYDLIYKRIMKRKHHFMPPELLKSQFETLEEPIPVESDAITIPIEDTQAMAEIFNALERKGFMP